MIFFRQTTKRTSFLWALLLSVALLCAQGVKLHVHSIDHDHDQRHGHMTTEAAEHSHLSEAHLSSDVSHGDHHDEVVSELDASPDGLLKKVSSNVFMLALLATVFSLLLLGFYQHAFHRRSDNDAILPWRYLLSPPSRAPPL
ncbi:MAG: hypothetical protein ABFS39_15520 [Pseudomonadota bacterium]